MLYVYYVFTAISLTSYIHTSKMFGDNKHAPGRVSSTADDKYCTPSFVIRTKDVLRHIPCCYSNQNMVIPHPTYKALYAFQHFQDDAPLRKLLYDNHVAAFVFATLLHRVFNTFTGQVGVHFARITLRPGVHEDVVVGNLACWQGFMWQLYTGWKTSYVKKIVLQQISNFQYKNVPSGLYSDMSRVTGSSPGFHAREGAHLMINFQLWHAIAIILRPCDSLDEFLTAFPPSRVPDLAQVQVRKTLLGQPRPAISTEQLSRVRQHKTCRDPWNTQYGDLTQYEQCYDIHTPTFGVEWTRAQLERLYAAISAFTKQTFPVFHRRSYYTCNSDLPIHSAQEVYLRWHKPPKDSSMRGLKDSNFSRKIYSNCLKQFAELTEGQVRTPGRKPINSTYFERKSETEREFAFQFQKYWSTKPINPVSKGYNRARRKGVFKLSHNTKNKRLKITQLTEPTQTHKTYKTHRTRTNTPTNINTLSNIQTSI